MSVTTETVNWQQDTLRVNNDGRVVGQLLRHNPDGIAVTATVTSYTYNNGESINHVPHVVVTDSDGVIVAEPHAYDSHNPDTAMQRARDCAAVAWQRHNDE